MKKTYRLRGLDCANCAAKIQEGISKLDGVSAASVSFATAKLVIEGDDSKIEQIIEASGKIIKRLEPDVTLELL
ncbi:MAG: heavy-metal-associated domain-containing protein [Clostridiales bacterium]|jgi:copper chaperone CopZ|nr:heavy-metal-associated domain-containing protein [Clostridiales bacterium]